jgi:hypothetical protein
MRFTRLAALPLLAAVALLTAPRAADAQIAFGVHAPMATSVGGGDDLMDAAFGVGGRIGLRPPFFPLSAWGTVDWFFPGGEDTSYQNFALDANLVLPVPLLQPYVTGGYVARRFDDGSERGSDTHHGWSAGAGVNFDFIVSAYLEARREFIGGDDDAIVGDDDQWLVRLGVIF